MVPRAHIGEILLYTLSKYDCDRYQAHLAKLGLQANDHEPGQVVPFLPTKIWSEICCNGQALMDGPLPLWITSAQEGTGPGTYQLYA